MKKGSAVVWIVWIVITILIAGGLVYYYQYTKIPDLQNQINDLKNQVAELQDQINATADETADWETYSSDTYRISFKYPKDWTLNTNSYGATGFIVGINSPETVGDIEDAKNKGLSEGPGTDITFYRYDSVSDIPGNKENNINATTLSEYINQNPDTEKKLGIKKIGGIDGQAVIESGKATYYVVYVEKDSQVYKIFFGNRRDEGSVSDTENKILETIQFTD